jgi:hypothetical protein
MLDRAVGDQVRRDPPDGVRRNGVADPVVAAGLALDLRVDADHATARVEERSAGVTVVDRGVGLDRVIDAESVRRLDRAPGGADDPRGHGAGEPVGAADRKRRVAHADVRRASESQRVELVRSRVDVDDGEVGRGVGADDRRIGPAAVGERDGHVVRSGDDVRVRDDVALVVEDETRALGPLLGGAER